MAAPAENEPFRFGFKPNEDPEAEAEGADEEGQDQFAEDGLGEEFADEFAEGDEEWVPIPLAVAEELPFVSKAFPSEDIEEVSINEELALFKGRTMGQEAAALLGIEQVATSDLLPGIYEGGFKLWEGSVDLCRHLFDHFKLTGVLSDPGFACELQGKNMLELGCGHGLPGIMCSLAGATVHFQDYNKEVLSTMTMRNAMANTARLPSGRTRGSMRFYSGDWLHTGEYLSARGFGGHYDYILTSESIYNVDSQRRLLECIKQVLQPPHGVAFVAAKSYYFGVGGGTKSFTKLVKEDGIFEVKVVYKVEEPGSGNVREVLELRWPAAIAPFFL